MAMIDIKLTILSVKTTAVYYIINYKFEGKPNEWLQIWYRTIDKDKDFVDFKGWTELKQINFNSEGIYSSMLMLERPNYTGQKVQIQAIGENNKFSNNAEIPALEPEKGAPPEPPELKACCPYCTRCFATTEELLAHIESEHAEKTIPQDTGAQIDKVAEALKYNQWITGVAEATGIPKTQLLESFKQKKPSATDILQFGTGKTPEEVYKTAFDNSLIADIGYVAMVTTAVALEALPTVDIGLATLSYMGAPVWSAANRMANDFRYSAFRYGTDPMLQRYWFKKETPLIPESYRLAIAGARGIITGEEYDNAMAEQGYNKKWADMWKFQSYEWMNFGQIAELYWRDVIDDPHFDMLMNLAGYYPPMISTLKELTKLIPPAQDLVTMVVREAFMPEMVTESPEVFAEYMGKKGFSKEWADRYWTMHWQPIPLRQAYENYWRGNWDKEKLDFALKIADVHPMWREDIINVSFGPPSIRELGYGLDYGRYTREDIIRYRRWGGLSPEDATKAADALIDYRTSAEWEAIRREMLWQFAHEQMAEEDYRAALVATGLQPNVVDLWVDRGLWQQERYKIPDTAIEYRVPTSSEALWAFKNNLKNEVWLRKTLYDLNWNDDRINLAVERALYEKAMKEDIPDIITTKTLTIAQLKSLYDAQLISKDALAKRLQTELHYTPVDATMLASIFTMPTEVVEPEPAIRKLTLAQLKQLYEAQIINKAQLIIEMVDSLNYDINDAYAIAELYTPKTEPVVKVYVVTSSEALWAFKNDLRDETWLRHSLSELAWTIDRINLAVTRAKIEKTPKPIIPQIIELRKLTVSQLKSIYNAQLISTEMLINALQIELNYSLENATILAYIFTKPTEELPDEETIFTKPYSDSWSRRLYAQRLLIEIQVYNNYQALGYAPAQAEMLTISMLIDDLYPMLTAQYSKGLINEEQFMNELILIGMAPSQALDLMERTIRDYQVDRLDDERKLTKAEIIKGYKNKILTGGQVVELLTDIGYEYWEAQYITALEGVVAAGDPETFWDMKKVTEAYKKALNRDNKPVSDEVLMLDRELKKRQLELKNLKDRDADAKTIAQKVGEVADYEARLRKVLVLTSKL